MDPGALRFYPQALPGTPFRPPGLPWFMTMFGRDSLITSFQALPFVPELALRRPLRILAVHQARKVDVFRDAEPGKIAHELRFGEKTAFEDTPHSPYYGTADATPLFLILLDEYERWTGDGELVQNLEEEARSALAWIERYGDRDGDGYLEYQRSGETGLENQCWERHRGTRSSMPQPNSSLPRATWIRGTSTTPSYAARGSRVAYRGDPPCPTAERRRRRLTALQPGFLDRRSRLFRAGLDGGAMSIR